MRNRRRPFLAIFGAVLLGACAAEAPVETSAPAGGEAPEAMAPPPEPSIAPSTVAPPPIAPPPSVLPSARPDAAAFPQFPCQPPNPSDLLTLDRRLVAPKPPQPATLGGVESRLKAAFTAAGFRQPRVYQTCGGFALVTSIERARADGTPFAEPGRFVDLDQSLSALEEFSLAGVLRALVSVQPGRFRLIALVVSDDALTPTRDTMSSAAASALATGGAVRLPAALADKPFTPQHGATALVYEFEKSPGAASAKLANPPRFSADQHLRLAGLLGALNR